MIHHVENATGSKIGARIIIILSPEEEDGLLHHHHHHLLADGLQMDPQWSIHHLHNWQRVDHFRPAVDLSPEKKELSDMTTMEDDPADARIDYCDDDAGKRDAQSQMIFLLFQSKLSLILVL